MGFLIVEESVPLPPPLPDEACIYVSPKKKAVTFIESKQEVICGSLRACVRVSFAAELKFPARLAVQHSWHRRVMAPKKASRPELHQTTLDRFLVRGPSHDGSSGLPRTAVPPPTRSVSTVSCKFFSSGMCRDGNACAYKHTHAAPKTHVVPATATVPAGSPTGSPAASRAVPGQKTPLCRYFSSAGGCAKGAACPALHYNDFGFGVVKVPWSQQNVYESSAGVLCRHWVRITEILSEATIGNTSDLEEVLILLLPQHARGAFQSEFSSLQDTIDIDMDGPTRVHFFKSVIPWMQQQVLLAPSRFPEGIPILRQRESRRLALTQLQVLSLLACAFFGLMPFRHRAGKAQFTSTSAAKYAELLPFINMGHLFGIGGPQARAKIRCLLEYFAAQHECYAALTNEKPMYIEVIRCVRPTPLVPQGIASKLVGVEIMVDGLIEDRHGVMQVDFANRMLGGGVFGRGCVQEEIRFVISPELLLSRIVCERLLGNEAVVINGAEQFSNYTGYASTFRFAGRRAIPPPTAAERAEGMRNVCVTAMDAVDFHSGNLHPALQYFPHWIEREIVKAHVAFSGSELGTLRSSREGPVATGNWGCGAFAGDLQLKMLIQLCAASATRRPLIYYTFGNSELATDFVALHKALMAKRVSVAELYAVMITFQDEKRIADAAAAEAVDITVDPEDLDATPSIDDLLEEESAELPEPLGKRAFSMKADALTLFRHVSNKLL